MDVVGYTLIFDILNEGFARLYIYKKVRKTDEQILENTEMRMLEEFKE